MEETPQTAAKSASKYHYYVEFSRTTTGTYVTTAERISEEIGHIEVSVQGQLYVSRPFRLGSTSNETILRIPLHKISLPLTTSPDIILKLYVHLKQSILLLGLQHLSFKYCRFPLENEFPVLRKHNNQRIYQLHVKLDRSVSPPETLWENTYAIGQLTHPGSPAHARLLQKKAVGLPKEGAAAFQERLFHAIASLFLKKYSDEKTKFFELSALHKQAYWDEFSTQLMSQNSLLFHAGDSKQKKHVFVDIDNHRVLITGTPSNNSIPQKVSSAAMVQLPNGNYILAGGVECDGGRINYDGLYYYNPRKGSYLKIGELPHYVHKLTLHYHNGHVLLFGGSDPKEDSKPAGSSSEPGTHGSSIYRYSLAKRKWLEQKVTLHHRVNDRVYSYFYKDKLLVTRKNGEVEVIGVDLPKDGKPEKNTWASSLFVASLSIIGPATFFVVSGQLYVIHKRANEELKKFRLQKFVFKADKASVTLVEELDLNNVSFSYVKAEVCPTTNELTETVYLFEQDDISTIKFTAGVLVKNAKGSPVTKGLLSPQHKEASILSNNLTNWTDACTSPIRYVEELEHRQHLSALPSTWSADYDVLLKPVIGGLHHSFWPLVTGQTLLFGYLQKVSQDGASTHQYKLNSEALSIRTNGWGSNEAVLMIPSCTLSTIRHGLIQVKSHLFFFGGLESAPGTVLEEQEVNPVLKSIPNKLTPTSKIAIYSMGNQIWKQIGLLPEPLYGCALAYDEQSNKLIVAGGYTSENTLSQKLYMWDLATFLLEELPLTLDLQPEAAEALEMLHLEGFLYIGTRSSAQTRIINIKERTVTQSECGLFHSRKIFSADRLNKLVGSKAEYRFLWADDSNPHQLKKKRVCTNFSEGGLWLAKQTVDFALDASPETPVEIVDAPYLDPVLAQEYSGKETPSNELQATQTPEEKEKQAEADPNKQKIKQFSFAVYDSKADFFGLDEVDHSKCYTDYCRENNFAVFSEKMCLETPDKKGAGDSLITRYSYTHDKFTVIDAKESTIVNEAESKPQYSQGLVSNKFLTNSLQIPLSDGSVLVSGGEAAHQKKLVASNQTWLTNITRGSWSLYTRMAETRSHHTGLRVGKYVYVFGGRRGASGEVHASCEKLNLATHVWEPMPNLQVPVCMAASVSLFGKIYIVGGETQSGTPTDCIQIYDILTGAFESLAKYQNTLKLAKPLKNLVALTVNFNTFFVAGGENKEKKPNMEIYTYEFNHGHNVASPEVTSVALYPHVGAKASIVDATVMIVGGNHFNGVTAYNLREKVPKEITSFRDARTRGLIGWTGDGLAFCESKIEYYIADTYIHSNPKFDKLYIFGMDQRNEVWRLNLKTYEWDLLEVPKNLNLWNYSIAVTLPDGRIFISGGIKSDLQKIQKEVFIITPQGNSLTAAKMPDMLEQRYTHTSVYLNNYVYCIGGRTMGDNNNGIHSHCERFNLQSKQWEQIANLNSKRCTATATSYRNHIYVLGGYQNGGRCAGIERYSESKNEWNIIPLNMDIPIEASVITHITDSEILLLGGKDQSHEQKYSIVYDLESNTCISKPEMKVPHVLAKGAKHFNEVFIIGGSTTHSIEKCNITEWKWEELGQVRVMPSKDFSKTSFAQSY